MFVDKNLPRYGSIAILILYLSSEDCESHIELEMEKSIKKDIQKQKRIIYLCFSEWSLIQKAHLNANRLDLFKFPKCVVDIRNI